MKHDILSFLSVLLYQFDKLWNFRAKFLVDKKNHFIQPI